MTVFTFDDLAVQAYASGSVDAWNRLIDEAIDLGREYWVYRLWCIDRNLWPSDSNAVRRMIQSNWSWRDINKYWDNVPVRQEGASMTTEQALLAAIIAKPDLVLVGPIEGGCEILGEHEKLTLDTRVPFVYACRQRSRSSKWVEHCTAEEALFLPSIGAAS